MPANAVKLINLPGVAVKATISNIVWVGGEINFIFTKLAFYVLFAWVGVNLKTNSQKMLQNDNVAKWTNSGLGIP